MIVGVDVIVIVDGGVDVNVAVDAANGFSIMATSTPTPTSTFA
ncbi:MAG TPA: hypothetical protein VMK66_09325 [Myxococcales bacterium]|nr:hypothetical protein [Myxococcales bacterium]